MYQSLPKIYTIYTLKNLKGYQKLRFYETDLIIDKWTGYIYTVILTYECIFLLVV